MDKEGAAQVISYGDHMERTRDTGAKQSCFAPVQTYCRGAKQHLAKDDIDGKILVSTVSLNRSGEVQEEASKHGCGDNQYIFGNSTKTATKTITRIIITSAQQICSPSFILFPFGFFLC